MPVNKDQPKRILGDLRIFQSVFNDLNMHHEIVTLEDGTQRYAYVYDGVDPYALEDSAFPITVQLIHAREVESRLDEILLQINSEYSKQYPDNQPFKSLEEARSRGWMLQHQKYRFAKLQSQPTMKDKEE